MLVWFFIYFPNWMTPNWKANDDLYRRCCFSVVPYFHVANEKRSWIFLFAFFVFWIRKCEMETWLPFSYFYYGIGIRKTKRRFIQHMVLCCFPFFNLAKKNNENVYKGSYFYFSFIVCGFGKMKGIRSYRFYNEIEKTQTKVWYIQGPYFRVKNLRVNSLGKSLYYHILCVLTFVAFLVWI